MITIQAEVNAEAFAHVGKLVDKVNRKAAKLGSIPFTIQNKVEFTKVYNKQECKRISFDVVGEIPVISGWKVIASIDHVERIVKGNVSPEYVKHANCEHCKQNRMRNITVILENGDGKQMQVGKSCLRDFLGHDPSMMLSYWGFIEAIETFCNENSEPRGIVTIDLQMVLAVTIASVKQYGYVSRKTSEDRGCNTTASDVMGYINSKRSQDQEFCSKAFTDHSEAAKAMMEWVNAKEVDPDNSYWYNLKTIVENDYVTFKSAGFAVSIIPTYYRETEVQREKESRLNEYFGSVGDKIKEMELEYVKSVAFDSYYGPMFFHFFKDIAGRCFKWGTGNSVECNAGDKVKVSGTIKAQELYKELKQTVLTRAKVKV